MATAKADVLVVGLGAWGGAAVNSLARRGYRVLGLDQHRPPHRAGSSHGRTRAFREATPEAEALMPLGLRAGELWESLGRQVGESLLERIGSLYVGDPESWRIADTVASLEAGGLAYELLEASEARRRYPIFDLADGEVVVLEPRAGVLYVEETIRAQLTAADSDGASLRFDERYRSWSEDGDGLRISTDRGTYRTDFLVLATGAWTPTLLDIDLPLEVERQVYAWLDDVPGTALQGPGFPTFAFPCRGPHELFYGFPGLRGDGIKVALHHGGETGALAELDDQVRDADLHALREAIAERIPQLAGTEIAASQTCRYVNSPDRLYALGHHPECQRVLIASGESGRGFKMTPLIGEMIADLIEGVTPDGFELLDLRRLQ